MRVGGIDGSNDNFSLMADILPRDTSMLAGAFTMSEAYINCTERVCLTCETPSVIKDEIRMINVRHVVDVKWFTACILLTSCRTALIDQSLLPNMPCVVCVWALCCQCVARRNKVESGFGDHKIRRIRSHVFTQRKMECIPWPDVSKHVCLRQSKCSFNADLSPNCQSLPN